MALEQFQAWIDGKPQESAGPTTPEGPDQYPLLDSSELKAEHEKISEFLRIHVIGNQAMHERERWTKTLGHKGSPQLATAIIERLFAVQMRLTDASEFPYQQFGYEVAILCDVLDAMLKRDEMQPIRTDVLRWLSYSSEFYYSNNLSDTVLASLESQSPDSDELNMLARIYVTKANEVSYADTSFIRRLEKVLPVESRFILAPTEVWAVEATQSIKKLPKKKRQAWETLLRHCATATGASPKSKWSKQADEILENIDQNDFQSLVSAWFMGVNQGPAETNYLPTMGYHPPTDGLGRIHSTNGNVLRGLAWLCPRFLNKDLLTAMRELCLTAYRKVPGVGPRAVKIGNSVLNTLGKIGTIEAVGELAVLKVRVKFGTAQKLIDKALNQCAEIAGVPRADLEEMAVPAYGLTEFGKRVETFGDFRCEQVIENSNVVLKWLKPDGKPQKSVPKAVKENHAEDLKELKATSKDIQRMIGAQSARIDHLYRAEKAWDFETWRERYIDHPLVGTIARRLIWNLGDTSVMRIGDQFLDVTGKPVTNTAERVTLWHPINATTEQVTAWRRFVEEREIRQPFKQAHREIYPLTAAEENTRTYSNRFASHILKQHQFSSLAKTRDWKNQLRLMVDDTFPPASIELPAWGLRAEFWVEGIGEEYGQDTNDAGVFNYIATDQVRFYPIHSNIVESHAFGGAVFGQGTNVDPVQLADIPPLAFSEVMRDVDLFVGVASVGNDPNWEDGGADGRYREYWMDYSFGELTESAEQRLEILRTLIPKLKIADRCSIDDRWLVVRGDLRTYRIHLGSANIQMEPNNQYLCIVTPPSAKDPASKVFLPFEGDGRLSVILSKAFLLANDTKIKDETILSQINR